jgi:hypothetical protein
MVSGSERYAEYGAVVGAHRPHTSDLSSKKISPDGVSCKQYYAPISKTVNSRQNVPGLTFGGRYITSCRVSSQFTVAFVGPIV